MAQEYGIRIGLVGFGTLLSIGLVSAKQSAPIVVRFLIWEGSVRVNYAENVVYL